MDAFGIDAGLHGAARVYFGSARRSGRTTALVESLSDGDRVVFLNRAEADRVARLCKELGRKVECIVVEPRNSMEVMSRGTPKGRTVFDHDWLEKYYLDGLAQMSAHIDRLQREASGYGLAHVETRMRAQEQIRWVGHADWR